MSKKLLLLFLVVYQSSFFYLNATSFSPSHYLVPLKYLKCPAMRHLGAVVCFTSAGWLFAEMLRDTYYGVLDMKREAHNTKEIIELIDKEELLSSEEREKAAFIQSISRIPCIFLREWFALCGSIYVAYLGVKLLCI